MSPAPARRVTGLVAALLVVALPLTAQAPTWKVDSTRAPTTPLDFVATEGTWMSADVSPDGRWIAFDLLGQLYEMPATGGEARRLTDGQSWNLFPRYSPDGLRILFTSDRSGTNALWVLRRDNDSLERVSTGDKWTTQGMWSPDGRFIYATEMDLGARFSAIRIDSWGNRTEVGLAELFNPPTHLNERADDGKVYFSRPGGPLYEKGFVIQSYDLKTGATRTVIERPGGAASPILSRDGRRMAYVHREDKVTRLVVHDLVSGRERTLEVVLDRDRQEAGAGTSYGAYPYYAWMPGDREILIGYGGTLHAVNAETGASRDIPFRAPVHRLMEETIRFPVTLPVEGKALTRSHRFGLPAGEGVVFEALGDLYYRNAGQMVQLTATPAMETSPAYDPATGTLYYAAWSDHDMGSLWRRPLVGRGAPERLPVRPSQFGSLALSPDGRSLAFLRGTDALARGALRLEGQGRFELMVLGPDRVERKVTEIGWGDSQYANNFATHQPPGVTFSPDGARLYFTEMLGDSLTLKRIRVDGLDEEILYYFPHAVRAVISPDLQWIAFQEYARSYLTPFAFAGKPVSISGFDKVGPAFRVDTLDGGYLGFTTDGKGLHWTRGATFYQKPLADVIAGVGAARATALAFEYDVAVPSSTIALTNARVVTMDGGQRVLDGATVVIRRNRIEAVGPGVAVPAGAKVYDLEGKTIIPGLVDAHAHYNPAISVLHTLEEQHQGLAANLAFGTTTMYEVYGNVDKDFLVSDLQRRGDVVGSRLLSVGNPIYGMRYFRPKLFRPIQSMADAEEVVRFNRDHGATALKDYVHFTRSARQQLYAAARKYGLNVVAETAVDPQMNWTQLMDGVSGLEHTVGLTPLYGDVVRFWGATRAGNTPTLIVVYNGPQGETAFHQAERLWQDQKLLRFFRQEELIGFRRTTHYFDDDVYAVDMASELRKLNAAGVSLQASGHGQLHGLDKHWELELLVRGGFSPLQALSFATIQSATYLGLAHQLGSIEPGKLADLVILDANPLEDIRGSRAIAMVMQNGVLYRGSDVARLYPDPRPGPQFYFLR